MADAPATVDEYLAGFSGEQLARLEKVRALIRAAAPEAEELVSYRMPSYKQGRYVLHFAGMKGHLGIYPGPAAIAEFAVELAAYKTSKGAVQFPWSKPFPYELLERIVRWNLAHR
ncbi:MAG: DUF1801 domain-containing protein [Propionibacteriaceae bacterium]|jgi:uncharacterized protein YdhG (YjbR/CyaY superfamily)|nr:DUF1801 domain-containing protein [Propionibacteriaceae bacterium]